MLPTLVHGFPIQTDSTTVSPTGLKTVEYRLQQGEQRVFEFTFSPAVDLTNMVATYLYQPPNQDTWWTITGSVASATVSIPWSSANDAGYSKYNGWVRVMSGTVPAYKIKLNLAMITTPGFTPSLATNVPAGSTNANVVSVFGRTGAVVADIDDYAAFYQQLGSNDLFSVLGAGSNAGGRAIIGLSELYATNMYVLTDSTTNSPTAVPNIRTVTNLIETLSGVGGVDTFSAVLAEGNDGGGNTASNFTLGAGVLWSITNAYYPASNPSNYFGQTEADLLYQPSNSVLTTLAGGAGAPLPAYDISDCTGTPTFASLTVNGQINSTNTYHEFGDVIVSNAYIYAGANGGVYGSGGGIALFDANGNEVFSATALTRNLLDTGGNEVATWEDGAFQIKSGAAVTNIAPTITDADDELPTSGAVVDYAFPLSGTNAYYPVSNPSNYFGQTEADLLYQPSNSVLTTLAGGAGEPLPAYDASAVTNFPANDLSTTNTTLNIYGRTNTYWQVNLYDAADATNFGIITFSGTNFVFKSNAYTNQVQLGIPPNT